MSETLPKKLSESFAVLLAVISLKGSQVKLSNVARDRVTNLQLLLVHRALACAVNRHDRHGNFTIFPASLLCSASWISANRIVAWFKSDSSTTMSRDGWLLIHSSSSGLGLGFEVRHLDRWLQKFMCFSQTWWQSLWWRRRWWCCWWQCTCKWYRCEL